MIHLCTIITPKQGKLSQTHPKALKEELRKKISSHSAIVSVNLTRNGHLILTMKKIQTAQEILGIDSILGVAVNQFVQTETITSRFLLRIDCSIAHSYIAHDLEDPGLNIDEVRHSLRKPTEELQSTTSVLVTCFGTSLPPDVKLWHQLYRVVPFYDKPRQCVNCHMFNHSIKSCRSTKICNYYAQCRILEIAPLNTQCASAVKFFILPLTKNSTLQARNPIPKIP